jgi:hypothetical protein
MSQFTHWNGLDRCIRQQQKAAILNFFLGTLGVDHLYWVWMWQALHR